MAKKEPSKYEYAKEDFTKGMIVIAVMPDNTKRVVREICTRPNRARTLEGWTANVNAFRSFENMKDAERFLFTAPAKAAA